MQLNFKHKAKNISNWTYIRMFGLSKFSREVFIRSNRAALLYIQMKCEIRRTILLGRYNRKNWLQTQGVHLLKKLQKTIIKPKTKKTRRPTQQLERKHDKGWTFFNKNSYKKRKMNKSNNVYPLFSIYKYKILRKLQQLKVIPRSKPIISQYSKQNLNKSNN